MELPLLFRAIQKLTDRLPNQPSQGKAMLVGHPLQAFKLFDGKGNRRSRSLHVSSICINLRHLTCVWMKRRIYGDIRNDRLPNGRYSADY